MERRVGVHAVTPDTKKGWVSKVQVVDMYEGTGRDGQVQYLNMIFQDEKEDQVKATVYTDLIQDYRDVFKMYNTYLIRGATTQLPTMKNEVHLHTYDWVITIKTVVDALTEEETPGEEPLPPPTQLTVTPFQHICNEAAKAAKHVAHESVDIKGIEYDILAVVVNCFPPRYIASVHATLQEVALMDINKQTLLLTIWEPHIIKKEGTIILQRFRDYPILLGRRIALGKFAGLSLVAKFNTTLQLDPPYPQTAQLRTWATTNDEMLRSFTRRSTSEYGTFINVPVDEEIISIADIPSQKEGHAFSIEGRISLPQETEYLHVVTCSNCGLELNVLLMRKAKCMRCKTHEMLTLRCRFDATLTDATGSTTVMFLDKQGEKLLDLTAEEIYDRTKKGLLPITEIQRTLRKKKFRVEAKKSTTHPSEGKAVKLYILSCIEKDDMDICQPTQKTSDMGESSKRKKDAVFSSDEGTSVPATETKLPRPMAAQLEPPTPVKKQ